MNVVLIDLLFAVRNFILYLTPLYLWLVRIYGYKKGLGQYLETLFNPIFIYVGSMIAFILVTPVWNNLIHPVFYYAGFLVTYIILEKIHKLSYFDNFFFSVMVMFAISELWEIPIIARSLFINDLYYIFQHLSLAFFKLVSVIILFYYIQRDFNMKDKAIFYPFLYTMIFFSVLFVEDWIFGLFFKIGLLVSFIFIFYGVEDPELYCYSNIQRKEDH